MVGRPWQSTDSGYLNVPYRLPVEDMKCFLFYLAIDAKNCRSKPITPKNDLAGWTGIHTRVMVLRIVIYKIAIYLLADLER